MFRCLFYCQVDISPQLLFSLLIRILLHKNAFYAGNIKLYSEAKLGAYIFIGGKLSSNVSFHSVLISGLR